MSVNASVPDDAVSVDDRIAAAVASILRRAAAEGREDAKLEEDTGVNRHTIKAYRLKTRKPSMGAGLTIAAVLGKWAMNKILHVVGYEGTPLDETDELKPMSIAATALQHLSTITTAAADGRIDHTERPICRDAADMIIATVLPLSSAGKA